MNEANGADVMIKNIMKPGGPFVTQISVQRPFDTLSEMSSALSGFDLILRVRAFLGNRGAAAGDQSYGWVKMIWWRGDLHMFAHFYHFV